MDGRVKIGAAIVVVALAVAAVAAGITYDRQRTRDAVEDVGSQYTLVDGSTIELTATFEAPSNPRAVFFGDSYTLGGGASSSAAAYPALAAELLGWEHLVIGRSGTGYVNPGQGGGTYATRLQAIVNDAGGFQPTIFVMQGGFNDQHSDIDDLAGQVAADIDTVKQSFPDVELVIFGPVAPTEETRATIAPINDQLALASKSKKVLFVNGIDFLLRGGQQDLVSSDGVHPSDEGHAVIAQKFANSLD